MSLRLLGLAAVAATALGVAPASAGCFSCGCGGYAAYTYVQPRVVYVQPPCAAYQRPVYVVNQGPTYTQPVPREAMPSPYIKHPPRPYPYGAGVRHRWHDHHVRHHRRMHGHFYRGAHRTHVAPMYRPHRVHGGPRIVHVPRHPAHPPMHPYRDPKHPVYAPRRRHYQP